MTNEPEDWGESRLHVNHELTRLAAGIGDLRKDIAAIAIMQGAFKTDIELLKLKAGLWGGVVGIIGGIIPAALTFLSRGDHGP